MCRKFVLLTHVEKEICNVTVKRRLLERTDRLSTREQVLTYDNRLLSCMLDVITRYLGFHKGKMYVCSTHIRSPDNR
jgi:hypothetical protein